MTKCLWLSSMFLGLMAVSSCNKPDQTIVCYFTPSIRVYPNSIPSDKSQAGLYVVDTASGNIIDSMNFENAFYQLGEQDDTFGIAFDINKEDRLFYKKNAKAHYIIVYNRELNTKDTLSHFDWESTHLKNGCVAINNVRFIHKGKTYDPYTQKFKLW